LQIPVAWEYRNAFAGKRLPHFIHSDRHVLETAGIEVVALTPEQSKYGAETGKSPGAAPISSDSIAIASMGS